jgi:hypothetical protein
MKDIDGRARSCGSVTNPNEAGTVRIYQDATRKPVIEIP